MKKFFTFTETVFKFKALKKVAQLAVINSLEKVSIWISIFCVIAYLQSFSNLGIVVIEYFTVKYKLVHPFAYALQEMSND